jgi:Protein of unknown function (DUF4232)
MTVITRLRSRQVPARRRHRWRGHPIGLTAMGLAGMAALAGCGSAAPPARSQAASSPSAGSAAAACNSTAIRVTLDGSAAGVAAGTSYVPLEFTNTTARSCRLPDYPAVSFAAGAAGGRIGAPAAVAGKRAGTVVLGPHGVAHAWLQIADVANVPAARCQPVQAGGLRVTLAGSATPAFLAHPFQACSAATGQDILAVYPLQAGQARRGGAP